MSGVEIFVCVFVWLLCGGVGFGVMTIVEEEFDDLDGAVIATGIITMVILGPFGLGWAGAKIVDDIRKSPAHK